MWLGFQYFHEFMRPVHHPQGPAILTEVLSTAQGGILLHHFSKLCIRRETGRSESAQLHSLRVSKIQQPAERKVACPDVLAIFQGQLQCSRENVPITFALELINKC